jgi:hypothetical protein
MFESNLLAEPPIKLCGYTFNLNRPHKWDIMSLLQTLQLKGIIRINGVDDIKLTAFNRGSRSLLKEVIQYNDYLSRKAG